MDEFSVRRLVMSSIVSCVCGFELQAAIHTQVSGCFFTHLSEVTWGVEGKACHWSSFTNQLTSPPPPCLYKVKLTHGNTPGNKSFPTLSPCHVPWAKYIKINSHHKSECHGIPSEKLFCFTRLPRTTAKSKLWHLRRLTPHPRLQFSESELMCGPVCVLLKDPLSPCMLICFGWNLSTFTAHYLSAELLGTRNQKKRHHHTTRGTRQPLNPKQSFKCTN